MIRAEDPGKGDAAYELADAFCRQARLRIDELFRGLWYNSDAVDRRLAERVLQGRYTWTEEGVLDPSGDLPWIAVAAPGRSYAENVRRRIG